MLTELSPDSFEQIRPVFSHLNLTAIDAVLAGNSPSRVFVDNAQAPSAAFLWNDFRYSFLAGDVECKEFVVALARLLREELFPAAIVSPDPTVVVYPDSLAWGDHMPRLIGPHMTIPAPRQKFLFDPQQFTPAEHLPEGFRLRRIDAEIVARYGEHFGIMRLLWTSPEKFLAHGFGFVVLEGDTLAGACLTGFVGRSGAEVDIFTQEAYRGRGLAAVTASAFITEALARGLTPVWECWDTNQPSIRVAEKVGFRKAGLHLTYFVDLTR